MKKTGFPSSYNSLIVAARAARQYSYSPYSRFRVGAALMTTDGRVYTGCNIENSSYGLTVCAERIAVFKAVSEGALRFRAMAIVSDSTEYTPPCGACRQVLMDFADNIDFILTNGRGGHKIVRMKELLPYPFSPKNLPARPRRRPRT